MRLKEWPDGTPIVVYVLPDQTDQHKQFAQTILAMLPHQLRRNWDRQIYTGTGQAPIEVANENEMIARVNRTPGAIGYIEKEAANVEIHTIQLD